MVKKAVAPATPATPAAVEVKPAKVAAKKGAVKLALAPGVGEALAALPAGASRTQRRAAAKAAPAVAAAPEKKFIPVKNTATAQLAGSLASISQARNVLHNSRSFGEALDTLGRLEAQAHEQLGSAIHEELKKGRHKVEGHSIGTQSKPDGVHIVLTKQQ
jgi:hypothetical protein